MDSTDLSENVLTNVNTSFQTPPNFEQTFKNPCFYDACHQTRNGTIRKLRCLPFFHVLGVDKCGSTDLYSRIVRHPQIFPNNGTLNKETMWWSWRRYGKQWSVLYTDFLSIRKHWWYTLIFFYFLKGHKLKVETHQKETFLRYLQYFDGLSNKLEHSQRDYSSITGFSYVEQNW